MIGLIAKVFLGIGIVIAGILASLNVTNVWDPGTIAFTKPDVEPCLRYAQTYYRDRPTELIQVRWIWTAKDYGWGCYFEFGDFDVVTVTPMPN